MQQQTVLTDLAADTLEGLSANPKHLLSKYFYDERGSELFQENHAHARILPHRL
jgi:L-histidine Nalpha-methyltransferase